VSVRRPTRLVPSRALPATTLLALGLALGCDPAASEGALEELRSGSLADAGAIEGRYELRIATLLDGGTRTSHHVKTPDGVYELVLAEPLAEPIPYDSWVRVPGELLDPAPTGDRWEADELQLVAPPPEPLIDAEPRLPRRIGTVLVFWDGMGLGNGNATDSMFTGNKSTNVYYGENSYGIETMAGKVFGPYQITMPGGCSVDNIVSQAEAAMQEKGHDSSQFRQMMYYFPSGLGCDFAGLASVGSPDNPARNSWYSGSFGCTTRNQELGHNYGMGHSHAYSCPVTPDGFDHPPYEDCEHIEYGHPYDPMGNGCGHMNVVQKTYMGWIDGCNVVTTTSSGTFNLLANELPCNGTQALRFPAYDGRYYYLEYRTGVGQFVAGSGVLINLASEVGGFGPPNYVLDELGVNTNGYLHEGDSFTDPDPNVAEEMRATFTVLEEHDSHAVIQVTLPNGGDGQLPSCRDGGEPIVADNGHTGSLECSAEPYPGDESPPAVQITYPADGDVFAPGSDFTITAEAMDDRGVIELELYLDGMPYDVLTAPPWEWEATNIPEGTYEFGVVARDARHWTPSNAVTIEVGIPSEGSSTGSDTGEPPASTGEPLGTSGDESSSGDSVGVIDGDLDDGCSCRQAGDRRGGAGMLLILLGLGFLRRRRSAA
jgi:MYXO-CTERM domain-containing protein